MAAILYFANTAAQESLVLAPIKNPNSMTWATSGPKLVLLEESEPKYPYQTNRTYCALVRPSVCQLLTFASISSKLQVVHPSNFPTLNL